MAQQFRGIAGAGLVALALVGASFVAIGMHALSAGWWAERPARPWFGIVIGLTMIVVPSGELVRRHFESGRGRR